MAGGVEEYVGYYANQGFIYAWRCNARLSYS